jgi:hypothetical protein
MIRLPLKWLPYIAALPDSSQWVASTTQRGISTSLNTPPPSTTLFPPLSRTKSKSNGKDCRTLSRIWNVDSKPIPAQNPKASRESRPRSKQLTTFADSRDVAQYSTFHLTRSRDCSKLGVKIGIPTHHLITANSVPDSAHYEELSTIFVPEFVNDMTCGGILCYSPIFRYLQRCR